MPNMLYKKTNKETAHQNSVVFYRQKRVLRWAYPFQKSYFRQVILRKDMDNDSALLLNAGARYVKVMYWGMIFSLCLSSQLN